MSSRTHTFVHQGDPERLDRAVVEALSGSVEASRSQVERWIEQGAVTVNGKVIVKPAYKLESGDTAVVTLPSERPSTLEPLEMSLDIAFEDKHLIVINKPAGLSMHPGAGNTRYTLANAIVQHVGRAQLEVGESDRPGIVHRLDKDTTGIVVVAKSTPVLAALSKQFSDRTAGRTYSALVFSTPRGVRPIQRAEEGEVDAPIGRHPTQRRMMAITERGRAAVTRWRVLERFRYGTLIECTLKTGRTHQIRVHLDSIGCPVIGDQLYGDFSNLPRVLQEAAARFGRQALHAATLSFTHPITQERLSFSAPLPPDFQSLLDVFRTYESR
jgi:23S rRNA pseudouridine1911/1915/1917 synthase